MRFILTIFIVLILSACKTTKVQPKIATDKNDHRIKTLMGTWYSVKDPYADRPSKFTKTAHDSCIIWTINKNGTIVIENQISHAKNKNKWILKNNKFYIQLNLQKEFYIVNSLNTISETELKVKFLGYKNVCMPFLCNYESMEYPLNDNVIEYPTNDRARYGETKEDFSNYINKKNKFSASINEEINCSVFIKTNCSGEVVEAKVIGKTLFTKKTEFEKSIVAIIEKMPSWHPATKRNLAKTEPINGGNRFIFTYRSGKIIIVEG